jgi:hypothetical protein
MSGAPIGIAVFLLAKESAPDTVLEMDPAIQTKSRKPFYLWLATFSVPIWTAVSLACIWERHSSASDIRGVMVILGISAAICVVLLLSYLLLPHQRGPYAIHLVAASIGGLTAISLTDPVFVPLIRIQMRLMEQTMRAINLRLFRQWYQIMAPYGCLLEIVLIGAAAGWIFVVIASKLEAKRLKMDG